MTIDISVLPVQIIEARKNYITLLQHYNVFVLVGHKEGEREEQLLDMSLKYDTYWIKGENEECVMLIERYSSVKFSRLENKRTGIDVSLSDAMVKINAINAIDKKEKVEISLNHLKGSFTEVERVLANGVIVHSLEVEMDIEETQDILDKGVHSSNVDAESAYEARFPIDQIATYEIEVKREEDYNKFINKLIYERVIHNNDCECKLCKLNPSYDEWKQGFMHSGIKLGKALKKHGYSKQVLDFYAMQCKTEEKVYLTISDLPQHIAGMSYYGSDWSSCQNPDDSSYDGEYMVKLGGSLYDDKLYIAMLHAEHADIEDMKGKMLARTILRLVHVDSEPLLVSTEYYGSHENRDMLDHALKELNMIDVYGNDIVDTVDSSTIQERTNGLYTFTMTDDVHIFEEGERKVMCECPFCKGNGDKQVHSPVLEQDMVIECPLCNGTGEYENYIYVSIDKLVEVEAEMETAPYAEKYIHHGWSMEIDIDIEEVRQRRIKNGLN